MTRTAIAAPAQEPDGRNSRRRQGQKHANGEGTISPRKDGRYEVKAYVLTTAGKLERKSAYARSYDEARQKLTELLSQSDQGIPVASESWTVAEYLNYWLLHVVREERQPKTYQGYEGVVRLHLIPGLGKKRLDKLTAREIRVFITKVREECQCCKHGYDAAREEPRCCALKDGECCQAKLSTRMVQSIHAVLRNALECAVREETIPRNVAKLVKVTTPKYKVNRGLTTAQAKAVLGAATGHRLYALYVLALCLGLRRGSCSACAGRTSTSKARSSKWFRHFSASAENFSSSVRRPRILSAPCRSPGSAWTLSASTRSGSSPSAPKPSRTGTTMGLCSPRPGELRWSPTTSAGAGAPSARRPVSMGHGFMIAGIHV